MFSLQKDSKITRVLNAVAAGTSDQNGSAIDMANFESVVFIVAFGAIDATAVTSIKAQQGAASDLSDAADLEGTKVSIADDGDNKLLVLEVVKPRERYVRVVVDRGTANAVIDGAVAIQYGARKFPVTHDTSVAGSEYHASPAEGTA